MDSTNLKEELLSNDDDEFYEKMEAPKFVDFTVPDRSKPDDSSWFCLRVGCNQKHEDLDPDALYKTFVIRVMAARSPNLRLQKILNRPSEIAKCPQSAPAKSAKDRVPRFSAITSMKVRRPLSKIKLSPSSGTAKQPSVTAKALTTPRYKKCPLNPEPFRSVRNPKVVTIVNPKNRVVARALDFHTPKKVGRTISSKYRTPISDIRAEMKKLEISCQRKNVQGHFCKSSRCAAHETKNYVPTTMAPAKSQIRTQTLKLQSNQAEISYGSGKPKGQEPSSTYLKKKSEGNLQKCVTFSSPQEEIDRESSDMEIDGKSRSGSLEEACSISNTTKEESLPSSDETLVTENMAEEESLPSSDESLVTENLQSVVSETTGFNCPNSLSNDEEKKDLEEIHQDETENMESSNKENASASDGNRPLMTSIGENLQSAVSDVTSFNYQNSHSNYKKDLEKNLRNEIETMDNPDKENVNSGCSDNENTPATDGNRPLMTSIREKLQSAVSDVTSFNYQNSPSNYEKDLEESHKDEIKTMDDPDKENALATNGNRDMNLNINLPESEAHVNDACQNPQKVIRMPGKTSHQSSTVVTAAHGGKCKIAKPTKPIPFRLRTDERGILKEAKLERKLHLLAPLKEIAPGSAGLPSGNLQRKPENEVQQNEKLREKCRYNITTQGGPQIESDKRVRKKEPKQIRTAHLKSERCEELKMAAKNTPQRQKLEDIRKGTQKMQKIPAKSPSLRRPRRVAAARKEEPVSRVLPSQLGVIKKTYATSRPKEAFCEVPAAENGTTAAGRASSRGKRSATIPKEPNFHEIHVPKSCTKKIS